MHVCRRLRPFAAPSWARRTLRAMRRIALTIALLAALAAPATAGAHTAWLDAWLDRESTESSNVPATGEAYCGQQYQVPPGWNVWLPLKPSTTQDTDPNGGGRHIGVAFFDVENGAWVWHPATWRQDTGWSTEKFGRGSNSVGTRRYRTFDTADAFSYIVALRVANYGTLTANVQVRC